MAETLTPQQRIAVENRGGKLLISAAAGSGKTKVLVDRLISYLTDPVMPANVDDFLIITYTKAAASELRSKIASKLSERIAASPENRHLQRQMQRLYLAKISTIHSFCSDIIREYAYMLDVAADFRVADENECLEMQVKILDDLLELTYADDENSDDFYSFVDSQGFGRNDSKIPEIILKVYNSARCHPHPEKWLDWCLEALENKSDSELSQTIWGKYLIDDLRSYLRLQLQALESCARKAACADAMEKPAALLESTIAQLRRLYDCENWDEIRSAKEIDYGRLFFSKKCTDQLLAEEIKVVRKACRDGLSQKLSAFSDPGSQIIEDLNQSASAARGLVDLVRKFTQMYQQRKRQRRVLDFGDLEHKMLDLLVGKSRAGITAMAQEIGARFREVMIDEYQDSNEVQDRIFAALTEKRQNCFMVGDVKQSIYQFRLADPEIFIRKYNDYLPADSAPELVGRKVVLSSNFRSSGGVIQAVNDVFRNCMSTDVGGVVYNKDEYLLEGIPHVSLADPEVELYGIAVQEDTYAEEAGFVARRVSQLLDGKHMVRSGDTLRPIRPDDIVILLRSPGSVGNAFKTALESAGINCETGSGMDLLRTEEVSVLRSLLQIISNPYQDIPLLAVLASRLFCFDAERLASIRVDSRYTSYYEAVCSSKDEICINFLEKLNNLRRNARLYGISQLIQSIFLTTRIDSIYAALPGGSERKENLQMFCQLASEFEAISDSGLDGFLEHLQALEERGLHNFSDKSGSGCVTIMSIHKSKGLEFPVVFLCGLSRSFNTESAYAPLLCHKDLGLGLSCVDTKNRVRYPSIAKRAISQRIIHDSISEEMRVLYVAMTRPKDRLIMTYASKTLADDLNEIILRTPHTDRKLITSEVICPGEWVLQTALRRTEAGELFHFAGNYPRAEVTDEPWKISVVSQNTVQITHSKFVQQDDCAPDIDLGHIKKSLSYVYGHSAATAAPSKLTATQLKGRMKDTELAEHTQQPSERPYLFRKPKFVSGSLRGTEFGNAVHTFMQYVDFSRCVDVSAVSNEIQRMVMKKLLQEDQANAINSDKIVRLFNSPLGVKIRNCPQVLREFKFSILDDSGKYTDGTASERVLLQGVVDCALIESDGITIIDFKTDQVTNESIEQVTLTYSNQVRAYADALRRIYGLPVKEIYLYYFHLDRYVSVSA